MAGDRFGGVIQEIGKCPARIPLARAPRSADVVTETPCRAYRLSAERFARLAREDPAVVIQFHSFVVKLLAKRLSAASDEIRTLL